MFPRSNQISVVDKDLMLGLSQEHLVLLHQKHDHYFFTINSEQYDWIRSLFRLMLKYQRKNYRCL